MKWSEMCSFKSLKMCLQVIAVGLFTLQGAQAQSTASEVFKCKLLSENYNGAVDSLDFSLSNPRLPNPVIIGANGSAPLLTTEAPRIENAIFAFAFQEIQGHFYIFYRYTNEERLEADSFRVMHLRFGDPANRFEGLCYPA
jgi:hypothetical protein